MGVTKTKEKEYAKLLYTSQQLTLKVIAERVGVSEKTLGKWAEDEDWEKLRKSLLTTKSEQLRRLYDILDALTTRIDESEDGAGDTKMADMMVKYTAAISNLETETSTGQLFETGMRFVSFVFKNDIEMGKKVTELFDAFIQSELNHKF
ncbi:MAG: hypothetical protein EBZ77_07955 [Chitinophagia bacterium]|nr:hypothetical protein [Chitinophagia bacterium]